MSFIEVRDVIKHYDGHCALNHVSMTVEQGKIYGLLGPNGAGKTSLIRILNQMTRPDSGEVLLNGKPINATDVMRIGYLPEERGLYKKMKVVDQIVFLGRLKGMSKADAVREARIWLERFDLQEWAGKKIEALSKGMAQKVQFISTVIHRPELLIFDEPFSGFDPVNAEHLKREIQELGKNGATIIFSTHNMSSVEEVCEDITLINKAEVVLQGNVAEIRQRFKKHLFNIHTSETLIAPVDELYSIKAIGRHEMGGGLTTIRLNDGVEVRTVIDRLNKQYSLMGFEELLPSMNEIFIETVTENHE